MKSLDLQSVLFNSYQERFQDWLDTLGYSQSSVYCLPLHLREFFYFLENNNVGSIENIEKQHIDRYFKELETRKNKRNRAGLSSAYLNKHLQALRNFCRLLQETDGEIIPLALSQFEKQTSEIIVLTKPQIQSIYRQIEENALGQRDRAMIGIYYGCGLRRSEGVALNVKDILLKKSLVWVRKGKNYTQRYVPISDQVKKDLKVYILRARKELLGKYSNEALFISQRGKRLQGQSLNLRLKKLLKMAGIQDENLGLHTLRHCIATHLLQSGMKLEDISRFLGHKSLESTQVYTHLINTDDEV